MRDRHVTVEINLPENATFCRETQKCPVAFISSGYGVKHNDYSFITDSLIKRGYLVVSVQHELVGDPPLFHQSPLLKHDMKIGNVVPLYIVRIRWYRFLHRT